jgi:Ca2+-binding EF-hand superfamily protein
MLRIAFSLIILTLTATAFAQPGDGHRRGPIWTHFSARFDTDGDGAISLAEFQANTETRFNELDSDGDGVITQADFDAKREEMREAASERRGNGLVRFADSNLDGTVTTAEWDAFLIAVKDTDSDAVDLEALRELAPNPPGREGMPRGPRPGRGEGEPGAALDLDGNGTFEIADLNLIFARLDLDGDGQLSAEELPEPMRRRFGRRGGPGRGAGPRNGNL